MATKSKADVLKPAKKKRETWAQTTERGSMTESIRVEKLDNGGYLVVLEKYGYENKDTKKEKYISTTKKLFSESNPLDANEADDPIMKAADMLTRN